MQNIASLKTKKQILAQIIIIPKTIDSTSFWGNLYLSEHVVI